MGSLTLDRPLINHLSARDVCVQFTAIPAYTMTARALHWVTAFFILLMIPLGVMIANEWGGSQKDLLYDLHRSLGAALIPILFLRLIYRLANPPLPLPHDIPELQQRAANMTHWSLYALLIAQPFVGWAATSTYPATITVFGWFKLPPIWPANRALSEWLFSVHRWIAFAITFLVVAHIAAALHHHFVRKDRVLMRMITG
jgi:cytochrome b561